MFERGQPSIAAAAAASAARRAASWHARPGCPGVLESRMDLEEHYLDDWSAGSWLQAALGLEAYQRSYSTDCLV